MTAQISYALRQLDSIPRGELGDLVRLGERYEQDIGGIDMGFGGMLSCSSSAFLLFASDKERQMIGFLLGSSLGHEPLFPKERYVYPTAAYVVNEYRNSAGQHSGVIEQALTAFVDTVEQEGYDRLDVFPPNAALRQTLVTPIGQDKVLKKLHSILAARAEAKPKTRYVGNPMKYVCGYLFNAEDYIAKVEAARK